MKTNFDGSSLTLGYKEEVSFNSKEPQEAERFANHWHCYCYEGQVQYLHLLWSNPVIKLQFANNTIPEQFFKINGDSEEEIWKKKDAPNPFLSLIQRFNLIFNKDREDVSLKAFNKSCVAVQTDSSYSLSFSVKYVELWYVAYLTAGIVIFLSGKSWSHNTYLHYSTGVTIGVMASIIFLLIFLRRLFPESLRKVSYLMIAAATSTSVWFWTYFLNQIFDPVTGTLIQYWQYILGYVILTGLISFCACYRYGPVTDTRSLNLIQWFIQLIGLFLVYQGTQIPELSVAIIVVLVTLYNIPKGFYRNRFTYYLRFKFFTPKRKFLTEEEYNKQANEETKKALDELRSFCQSPKCDTWKVVSLLSTPTKFAKFVEGDSWHVTDEELLEYDSGPEPLPPGDLDSSDEEDEMDFILSSP
ncbi:nuclear envelope integral membrane protein 1-like isoform X2 [Ylistrum balloti]|uniref:nuclear envelope integral membrane protein 1-like isoform X2 n=1 Tax=Ylistrum balloti TaxID=509963 RepID=UPI002905F030|nr:nuclear envelope integral membrane protein 1-like isoform X2 [Ylistrum balloti]